MCVSGGGTSKPSTIEVTEEMEKEVMTLDDEETFGNFYKTISPSTSQVPAVILTEDDLCQIQSSTPTSVNSSSWFFVWWFTMMKRPDKISAKCENGYNNHWTLKCLQAHFHRCRTQASSSTSQKESGLQEPSAGPGCPQWHQAGLHRTEA